MINTTPANFFDALANGRASSAPFVDVFSTRNPNAQDVNFPTQKKWWNTVAKTYWILSGFSSAGGVVSAIWDEISGTGGAAGVFSLGVTTGTPNPVLPDGSGKITITGSQVTAGTVGTVVQTHTITPSSFVIEVQAASAVDVQTPSKNGVAHFNSNAFTVSDQGFVQLIGGQAETGVTVDQSSGAGTNPVRPDPATGLIQVTGGLVNNASITSGNVIQTNSLAANQYTIQIQKSGAVTSMESAPIFNGVCHFDSAAFTVSNNGFVQLLGGGEAIDSVVVDAFAAPAMNTTVLPAADGHIRVMGGQISPNTTANAIQTKTSAANTYIIGIQQTSSSAASTASLNGIAHFNSAQFSVDDVGFVSLVAGTAASKFTVQLADMGIPNPVTPDSTGNVTISGAQVANDSIVTAIRTHTTAINSYLIEIQQTAAVGAADPTKNGVAHFDSAIFTVGDSGFVSLVGGIPASKFLVQVTTGGAANPVVPSPTGQVTISGAQIANTGVSGTARTLQTHTAAANTYTLDIQRSIAVTPINANANFNGVSHFDSTSFSVDSSTGFVTLVGGGFTWTDEAGAFSAVKNNGYFATATATGTLPASPAQGDTIKFFVDSASQFLTIQASGSQIIRLGSLASSAGGTATSTLQGDSVELVYRAADTCWCAVCGYTGTWMMA
jgi:hypothetical protein